jgi:type VI secretion system secreted protein Hcp
MQAPRSAVPVAGSGKASFSDFNFTHHVDKASPNLMRACATGEHIKEATITARKAGKGQQEFLIIKMNDVIVTSVAVADRRTTAATVGEHSRSGFGKVDLEYKPRKPTGPWMPASTSSTTSRRTRWVRPATASPPGSRVRHRSSRFHPQIGVSDLACSPAPASRRSTYRVRWL